MNNKTLGRLLWEAQEAGDQAVRAHKTELTRLLGRRVANNREVIVNVVRKLKRYEAYAVPPEFEWALGTGAVKLLRVSRDSLEVQVTLRGRTAVKQMPLAELSLSNRALASRLRERHREERLQKAKQEVTNAKAAATRAQKPLDEEIKKLEAALNAKARLEQKLSKAKAKKNDSREVVA